MKIPKTKAITAIENKMDTLDGKSLRYQILQSARRFKTSWIELGQYLQTVWREKHFRDWGYASFESYCSRELGVKHTTALKLLRSYYFLEKEEPLFLTARLCDSSKVGELPPFESVDILRRANNSERLHEDDYQTLRYSVLDRGEDPGEIRSKMKNILASYEDSGDEAMKAKRHTTTIRRFLNVLKGLRREIEHSGMLSPRIVREVDRLIEKIETQI